MVDPKGFHIFDTETRELKRIINPYTIFKKYIMMIQKKIMKNMIHQNIKIIC